MFWNRPQQPGEVRKRMKALNDGLHCHRTQIAKPSRSSTSLFWEGDEIERSELALLVRALEVKVALPLIDAEVN